MPFVLNGALERSREYKIKTVIISNDVPSAYDNVLHDIVGQSLLEVGLEGQVVWWLLKLLQNMIAVATCCGVQSGHIKINRGIPQGARWGPKVFNIMNMVLLKPVSILCQTEKLGFCARKVYSLPCLLR